MRQKLSAVSHRKSKIKSQKAKIQIKNKKCAGLAMTVDGMRKRPER